MKDKFLFLFLILSCYLSNIEADLYYIASCPIILENEPCNSDTVKFFLYTRKNMNDSQYVKITDEADNITNSFYKDDLKTKIIVHGYNADMNLSVLVKLKDAYLKKYDANVWMVDWAVLVPSPCYPTAVYNVRYAGKCLAKFIDKLRKRKKTGTMDLHVVGFSLGAHVPANAAPHLKPYQIPRITGLDPALPLFLFGFISNKLDAEDGEFVDIVHTNGLLEGQVKPIGHVDFYMNGGVLQPGCGSKFPTREEVSCSHHRSVEYFAESINTEVGFWGWRCIGFYYYITDRCHAVPPFVLMGEHVNKTLRGTYSVDTNSQSPFAIGKKRLLFLVTSIPPFAVYYPVVTQSLK
ncbi:pancreatic triacylglycerol lipase-like [Cimex lectularius]|uniref:Lipase domain-containing protein n=1 Tax=Cimex lectularius TaxID=79782 RepID=A0A8I6RLD2_CIMLE|nr:pancreatic triacylglycerol lipase-like [Cimex lectularius]